MQTSQESFWSEIKSYEDRLRDNPASYCFSSLAEVYLKAGLREDALAVARAGVARYPAYAAGQMALAKACHQAGLFDECRQALLVVTDAVPNHADAQRLLARLYDEAGMHQEAAAVLQVLLDFYPDDVAIRDELAALQKKPADETAEDDLELIEFTEADIIDESEENDQLIERFRPATPHVVDPWAGIDARLPQDDVVTEAGLSAVWSVPEQQLASDRVVSGQDPLETPTLAELYVSQGFPDKAVAIYRKIVAADPQNTTAIERLGELTALLAPTVDEELPSAEDPVCCDEVPAIESAGIGTSRQDMVTVLEGWIGNIKRLRTCH